MQKNKKLTSVSTPLLAPPAAAPGLSPADPLPEACANEKSSSRVLCEFCMHRRTCLLAACLAVFRE